MKNHKAATSYFMYIAFYFIYKYHFKITKHKSMVDTSKLLNSKFLGGDHMCVGSDVVMMKDNIFHIIQFFFLQSPGIISLVVHSRVENQLSDQLEAAHNRRFYPNPTYFSPSILTSWMLVMAYIVYAFNSREYLTSY